jgi:hypothetical protein
MAHHEVGVSVVASGLMDVGAVAWSVGAHATRLVRIDVMATGLTVHLDGAGTVDHQYRLGRGHLAERLRGALGVGGVGLPRDPEVIPTGERSMGVFWAFLVFDLGHYAWAMEEEGLSWSRIELAAGGAVLIALHEGRRLVGFVPLPPSSDTVGMAFEFLDWIAAGPVGVRLDDRTLGALLDKPAPASADLPGWAADWLDAGRWR